MDEQIERYRKLLHEAMEAQATEDQECTIAPLEGLMSLFAELAQVSINYKGIKACAFCIVFRMGYDAGFNAGQMAKLLEDID